MPKVAQGRVDGTHARTRNDDQRRTYTVPLDLRREKYRSRIAEYSLTVIHSRANTRVLLPLGGSQTD